MGGCRRGLEIWAVAEGGAAVREGMEREGGGEAGATKLRRDEGKIHVALSAVQSRAGQGRGLEDIFMATFKSS